MVPAVFITLETLPLTPTGKVDRRSLPPPQGDRPQLENPYVAPSSPLEETLVKIWADVLRLQQVGVHDHFLELGGNSLLATILVSRVLKALHVQVALRTCLKRLRLLRWQQYHRKSRHKYRQRETRPDV